jgi:hypothetical protein
MNTYFPPKRMSLVLLVVMLLNPIVGLAGSFFLENTRFMENTKFLENTNPLENVVHDAQMVQMSSDAHESCHEQLSSGSSETGSKHDMECCEDLCQCSQMSCYSPLALLDSYLNTINENHQYFPTYHLIYLSPSLSSFSPPPIV